MKTPHIEIKTDGITGTEIFIDGEKLKGVSGIKFLQSYKENGGLPELQIDLKATNVTLDAKMLPALPPPFQGHYLPISTLLESEDIPDETLVKLCSEHGIDLEI